MLANPEQAYATNAAVTALAQGSKPVLSAERCKLVMRLLAAMEAVPWKSAGCMAVIGPMAAVAVDLGRGGTSKMHAPQIPPPYVD